MICKTCLPRPNGFIPVDDVYNPVCSDCGKKLLEKNILPMTGFIALQLDKKINELRCDHCGKYPFLSEPLDK